MKKIFLIFAAMCCIMVANAQQCEVDGVKYKQFDVDNDGENWEVVGYTKQDLGDLVIPEKIKYDGEDWPVRSIAIGAFRGCTGLTSVTIPWSVGYIKSGAFEGCTGLTSVDINCHYPDFYTNTPMGVFQGCTGLKAIIFRSLDSNDFSHMRIINGFLSGVDINTSIYISYGGDVTDLWGFTNVHDCNLYVFRTSSLDEINAAKEVAILSEEEVAIVDDCIETIKNTTEELAKNYVIVEDARIAAMQILNQGKVKYAIDAIKAAMQGETGEYITGLAQQYIDSINSSTDVNAIDNIRNTAVEELNEAVAAYRDGKVDGMVEAFGSLGKQQNGPALIVTDQDGNEIILYSPKSVEYIKVNDK